MILEVLTQTNKRNSRSSRGLEELEDLDIEIKNDTAISFLDPNAIRWMNKRRQKVQKAADGKIIASNAKPLVTPSQALYLRNIFKGLDYENQGEMYV